MQIRLKEGVLADHCRDQDISRDELARRMGVSSSTAFRIEKGDVLPSPKFIAALMHITHKPFEELFLIAQAVA